MDALKTRYINLWEENEKSFLSDIDFVDDKKKLAKDILDKKGLPLFKSENYQKTDLQSIFQKNWNIKQSNGIYGNNCKSEKGKLFVGNFADFLSQYPQKAEKYYCNIDESYFDGLVALNTLLAKNILVVYIEENAQIETPVDISKTISAMPHDMVLERILLITDCNTKADILFCNNAHSSNEVMLLSVMEIFAEQSSDISITFMENTNELFNHVSSTFVSLSKDSKVCLNSFTISNGMTRNNFYCNLNEENAALYINGLALGFGKQHVDNYSYINHKVPYCTSNESFKYVLSDESRGVFTGKIYVAKDSQKTEAYQNNKNLIASDKAKMFSKPQLEIYADDVKCSHGMTTGQLDENAIFYMRQRGITYQEAKRILTIAFTEDILKNVGVDIWQDNIRELIDNKFRCN